AVWAPRFCRTPKNRQDGPFNALRTPPNLRHFTNRFVSWGKTCHGAALASIALALSEGLREVKIASTYDWEHLFPWGSHPQLDPLWSNGKVVLTHDGCEATRLDKTHLVSRHPIALQTLRVCFEN